MTTSTSFKALVLDKSGAAVTPSIRELAISDLPDGEVRVSVAYSTLNYKDGLAVTGAGPVVRKYPMVPGIDLAGTVERSSSPRFKPGDRVLATGWGLGESHWGGYAQKASVMADWLVPVPADMTLESVMAVGTAGFTAMLAIMAMEELELTPGGRPVLVTGAAGGVGSMAVAMLATLGYTVTASTGRSQLHSYLRSLGATDVIDRAHVISGLRKPLDSQRWDGAIDTVGGQMLAGLLPGMSERSCVAVCGNAGGPEFSTTVFPFILRGVSLLGIESVRFPASRRPDVWNRIARALSADQLEAMTDVRPLADVPHLSSLIVNGEVRGRTVIDIDS